MARCDVMLMKRLWRNRQIIWLGRDCTDKRVVGAKAASLSRIMMKGFRVPSGFCITRSALQKFIHTALNMDIRRMKALQQPEVESLIMNCPFPDDQRAIIAEAYSLLLSQGNPGAKVAVRSSATAEDSKKDSYAGQFRTILNVSGEEKLFQSIKHCWCSSFKPNVGQYARWMKRERADEDMAVLIQLMVPAEYAGVVFTTDPQSGNDGFLLIEVTAGLGDGLMGGRGNGVRLKIEKQTCEIIEYDDRHQGVDELVFRNVNYSKLIRDAIAIDHMMGSPQDIEWAFGDGEYWILQIRPITSRPDSLARPMLTRANIGEVMPGVVTPLTWSTFMAVLKLAEKADQQPRPSDMIVCVGGWPYLDMRLLWNSYSGIAGIDPSIVLSKGIGCDTRGYENHLENTRLHRESSSVAKTIYVWTEILSLNLLKPKIIKELRQDCIEQLKILQRSDINIERVEMLWHDLQQIFVSASHIFTFHMRSSFIALCSFGALWQLLSDLSDEQIAGKVISMTSCQRHDPLHYQDSVQEIIREVTSSSALLPLFRELQGEELLLELMRMESGRRILEKVKRSTCVLCDALMNNFELSNIRDFSDVITYLNNLRNIIINKATSVFAKPSNVEMMEDILDKDVSNINLLQRWFMRRIYNSYIEYCGFREETKTLLLAYFGEMKRRYVAIGRHLQAKGVITEVDDLFYLNVAEVEELLLMKLSGEECRKRILQRRETAHNNQMLGLSYSVTSGINSHQMLSGIPASGGLFTGRARIVSGPQDREVEGSEILIAEYADPAWMHLYAAAGAIVCEIGGMLSHSAILFREMQKPAVFQVENATRIIRDGQILTVDGWRGQVYLSGVDVAA